MTKSTQAQIEAASIAIADIYNVRLRDCTVSVAYELARGQTIEWAKAALTAAAQVGEQHVKETNQIIDTAIRVATIERCAQVALNAELTDERHAIKVRQQIAAAIRKLKDAP